MVDPLTASFSPRRSASHNPVLTVKSASYVASAVVAAAKAALAAGKAVAPFISSIWKPVNLVCCSLIWASAAVFSASYVIAAKFVYNLVILAVAAAFPSVAVTLKAAAAVAAAWRVATSALILSAAIFSLL